MPTKIIRKYSLLRNSDEAYDIALHFEGGGQEIVRSVSSDERNYLVNILRTASVPKYETPSKIIIVEDEKVGPPDLGNWLKARPNIRKALVWVEREGGNNIKRNYDQWTISQKNDLHNSFNKIIFNKKIRKKRLNLPEVMPIEIPPKITKINDNGTERDVSSDAKYAKRICWNYYISFVATSLAIEISGLLNWSISGYSEDELLNLFDSSGMFRPDEDSEHYTIVGYASPGDPTRILKFLQNNKIIGDNPKETIERIIYWCRILVHDGGYTFALPLSQRYEIHWQYPGPPPVERVINGTNRGNDPQQRERYTFGCMGTTYFLRMILRVVNIPVEWVRVGKGHSSPHFVREDLYLSHGDDPYNGWANRLPYEIHKHLLIDREKFTSWFRTGDQEYSEKNVGKQVHHLRIEYLPNNILYTYCFDKQTGRSHIDSGVYHSLSRYYSLQELESLNLWQRMEDKVNTLGGCDNIPPTP